MIEPPSTFSAQRLLRLIRGFRSKLKGGARRTERSTGSSDIAMLDPPTSNAKRRARCRDRRLSQILSSAVVTNAVPSMEVSLPFAREAATAIVKVCSPM